MESIVVCKAMLFCYKRAFSSTMIRDINSHIIDGLLARLESAEIASSAQQTGRITSDHHDHQLHALRRHADPARVLMTCQKRRLDGYQRPSQS